MAYPLDMRSSLEHLPERKQREFARVVEIIHEEFADALEGSSAAYKKRGRILKNHPVRFLRPRHLGR
ncbi:hypothetical protein [Sinorhizobium meliloti]|uniref:hypothetical protein n=1 Tax=Rhizobium meliloti TaxID=382 RepID=UPI003B967CBB